MALTLQIKRSSGSTAPSSLQDGEMAYTHGNEKLFIGDGSTVKLIGGKSFNDLIDHTAGTLTASSTIIVDANKAVDDLIVGNNGSTGGSIKIKEGTSNGVHHIQLKAPNALGANLELELPGADGSSGQFLSTNGSGTLAFADVPSGSFTLAADSGTNDVFTTGQVLTFEGGTGLSSVVSNNKITFSLDSIANSSLANNTVSYGGVSLALGATDATPAFDLSDATNYPTSSLAGTITNAQLAGSIANAKLANDGITIGSDDTSLGDTITDLNGLTSVDVDNITLDANTVSTTNSNGNLVLAPNGTGAVNVPSGYEARAGFGDDSLVNKSYVDAVANGLDVKASVKVATTANLAATYNNGNGTLTASSNGAIAVDGVTLSANDRVLVKDQTTQTQNGFYKVTATGSGGAAFVLTRTPDADAASELTGGAFTFVEEGTANADNGYVLTTNGTPTLGTTNITFEQFSGAGQISAGAGLTKTGNTIDVVGTADKITVTANALTIASTYVGQSSITTLGTITTGVWNGTAIAATSGGTGLSSIAKGSVLVANSANTLSALDGGGSNDGLLLYTASSDTLSFATSIDGGTF